ncbi:hypothetical protein [Herpetosiphon llansteffanensis]|uniref:hypothetical protein n=1 Tax=Herpetosiphon llansteffanensis TaxID=2094568 RepID=UPI000F519CE5|nr:hypothetical protein [Herpetosiphon llansteffanensis]
MSDISFSKVNQIVNDLKTAEGSALIDHIRTLSALNETHSRIVVTLLELLESPAVGTEAHTRIIKLLRKEPHASVINRSSAWKLAFQKYEAKIMPIVNQPDPIPALHMQLSVSPTPIMTSAPINQAAAVSISTSATKSCPYCAEQILADAKKCRFCNEWLSGSPPAASIGTTPNYGYQLIQSLSTIEVSTRAMMITGFLLFFLFFSPFVACGSIEMSAGTVTLSSFEGIADNRSQSAYSNRQNNTDGAIMWLSLLFVPITGATLFFTGMSMSQDVAANITRPQKPIRTQVLVIITVFVLLGLGLLIAVHPILELLWGYYAIMTCLATAFWVIKRIDYA